MDMPRPGPAQALLARFAGRWSGPETMSPSPFSPGGEAVGTTDYKMGLGGLALIQEYRQTREGGPTFEGHGVMLVEPGSDDVLWWWFDSMGFPAEITRGRWDGDTLIFERSGPQGDARYTYTWLGDDRYTFVIDMRPAGSDAYAPFMRGDYARAT